MDVKSVVALVLYCLDMVKYNDDELLKIKSKHY